MSRMFLFLSGYAHRACLYHNSRCLWRVNREGYRHIFLTALLSWYLQYSRLPCPYIFSMQVYFFCSTFNVNVFFISSSYISIINSNKTKHSHSIVYNQPSIHPSIHPSISPSLDAVQLYKKKDYLNISISSLERKKEIYSHNMWKPDLIWHNMAQHGIQDGL